MISKLFPQGYTRSSKYWRRTLTQFRGALEALSLISVNQSALLWLGRLIGYCTAN
jgi:hypothetical protein